MAFPLTLPDAGSTPAASTIAMKQKYIRVLWRRTDAEEGHRSIQASAFATFFSEIPN